jgi:sugar phosphate permease
MDHDLKRKVLRYRWLVFWVMAMVYVSAFFHRVSPAVVALDIQQAFDISAGLVGLLSSTYFYAYAFIQFPAGLLSDSMGPRKTVTIFLLIGAVGSFLFGNAPDFTQCLIGRLLVGLGAGMAFTPTMKIISGWFRVSEFATMNGITLAMGGVGALTAAAPLALVTGMVGWRVSFEIIAVGTIFLAAIVWITVRNRPEDLGWPSLREIDPVYGNADAPVQRKIGLWAGARMVLTEKYFWAVAGWSFFSMGCFFAFGGLWAGPYLMHVYGMTRTEAGNVLNMLAVGIVAGSPCMAYLSEKIFRSRKKVLVLSAAILTALLIIFNVFPSGIPHVFLYPLFLLFSATSLAPGVMSITTTKELFPVEITGTSIGTVNLFPFVGGALMQVGVGWLLDAYPKAVSGGYSLQAYSTMTMALLIAAIIGLICALLMKETFSDFSEKAGADRCSVK